jgi:hypothetical protein
VDALISLLPEDTMDAVARKMKDLSVIRSEVEVMVGGEVYTAVVGPLKQNRFL